MITNKKLSSVIKRLKVGDLFVSLETGYIYRITKFFKKKMYAKEYIEEQLLNKIEEVEINLNDDMKISAY